ncbi:MAG TPA: hypothetical protein DEO83_07540 [Lachnospiraceae bacterium]|nr:hypothetical protein [Lachnospiraceae bacterium]
MNGTIGSRILNRSIVKHIPGCGMNKAVMGMDYSIVSEDAGSGSILVAATGYSSQSVMAIIRAVNNLAMSGAAAKRLMINIVAGTDVAEQQLRDAMKIAVEYASSKKLIIIGGNTVCQGEGSGISFNVTAYGWVNTLPERRFKPGDKVIVYGNAGQYGASVICRKKRNKLLERFAEPYLKCYEFTEDMADISRVGIEAIKLGASLVHDVSFGGIYRSLYEISELSGYGMDIIHEGIPIKQSTIELCEFFNLNPYMLLGTGGAVIVSSPDKLPEIEEYLSSTGVDYGVAGELTKDRAMTVRSTVYEMRRSLTMYEIDEIYKTL